ncbi:acetoacetate decarboxylase [Rhodococcus sp. WMMA185]|uniref:acetoacetate decarboxylase family protein n=1 Tax=Rhodococcus sp. WMMA185 TaxID=679318 RepID=UPI0008788ACC|nr:acetoacetate decarboxylase family protein [Rhodococcus sp. WMMA185]AOW93538.1 acetoacetate decarboxylase [Rhodococcus sp. WMMA185]
MTSHQVLGKQIDTPVEVRRASAITAMYSVPATAAQDLIAHTGLEVLQFRPGRGVCVLVFVDYVDGDLGPYNEFGVVFLVRDHRAAAASVTQDLKSLVQGRAGALIHRLPVDGEFTMAAGRSIWGFPKTLADFDVEHSGSVERASVSQDDRLIAQLSVKRGIRVPAPDTATALAAYSNLDGVTRVTTWQMRPNGVRSRPGGAELKLGSHPIADELRSLGLPRRALVTSSIPDLPMTFGDAQPI